MTLTTTDLFGQTVEYPITNLNESSQNQVQEKIADTLTGNLFLQDFVKMNSDELSYIL
jgi:hypothetical protein